MRITREFAPYNERRYSKPWIAIVTAWPVGEGTSLRFGGNVGRNLVEIDARAGDLIRWGQRDNRGGKGLSAWGRVTEAGEIEEMDQQAAREYWLARENAPVRPDEEPGELPNADICPAGIHPVVWWIEKARFWADNFPHSSRVQECLRNALAASEAKDAA